MWGLEGETRKNGDLGRKTRRVTTWLPASGFRPPLPPTTYPRIQTRYRHTSTHSSIHPRFIHTRIHIHIHSYKQTYTQTPHTPQTASQLTTTPPITKQNRGEQAASTLEANLTNLEGKLDEILASFGVSAADLDALDEQEAAQKKKGEGQECGKKGKGEKGGSS